MQLVFICPPLCASSPQSPCVCKNYQIQDMDGLMNFKMWHATQSQFLTLWFDCQQLCQRFIVMSRSSAAVVLSLSVCTKKSTWTVAATGRQRPRQHIVVISGVDWLYDNNNNDCQDLAKIHGQFSQLLIKSSNNNKTTNHYKIYAHMDGGAQYLWTWT